jgi:hypothetical protein
VMPCSSAVFGDTALSRRNVLGVTLQSHEVQGPTDFTAAFAAIAEEHPQALNERVGLGPVAPCST